MALVDVVVEGITGVCTISSSILYFPPVLSAKDLPPVRLGKKSKKKKHFVAITLGGTERRTSKIAGINPTWNESFTLYVLSIAVHLGFD